jgi:hypothetical protein
MITVQEIELPLRIPSASINMVFMQPYIEFETPHREPYKWSQQARGDQLKAIERTLELAARPTQEERAHFTVFPEYSVPGLDGINLIDEVIHREGWRNESVIIAGIDGLTKGEYNVLCSPDTTRIAESNAPDRVSDHEWINCCVTWTKDKDGHILRWVQPKIRPAQLEKMTPCKDMFQGSSIFLFKCSYERPASYPCRFFPLICYDWVVKINGISVWEAVLSRISEIWDNNPNPIHWVFILQQNIDPNHDLFLDSTYNFLMSDSSKYQAVERHFAAVILVNNAAEINPCRDGRGGFTSFVFHPDAPFDCTACRPTICMQPEKLRHAKKLSRCKDILFREMGACIHSCRVRVPKFVTSDPTDRTYPIEAEVYGLVTKDDPRLPGGPVPASVKWINDDIDVIHNIASADMSGAPLQEDAGRAHSFVATNLRYVEAQGLTDRIRKATATKNPHFDNVDSWENAEHEALEHMLYTLSALGICHDLNIADSTLHGTLQLPHGICQVVAVRGQSHDQCRRHFDETVGGMIHDPIILITRDPSNLQPTLAELSTIFDPFLATGLRFKDYQSLVTACRRAGSKEQLREALNDLFKPFEKKII